VSCERTRAVLDKEQAEILSERPAKKQPLSDDDVKKLLAAVDEVVIAKGKASRTLKAKDAALDDLRGPTGNFRAPMLRRGKTLLVGFSEPALRELLR
jgi:arsenate reductase-like glutaredoxin family protein